MSIIILATISTTHENK
ncbi:hypothetical protein [uncultured Escherichia sp.]|nr:hypothetical protein [uncultured Escherichia sp.]